MIEINHLIESISKTPILLKELIYKYFFLWTINMNRIHQLTCICNTTRTAIAIDRLCFICLSNGWTIFVEIAFLTTVWYSYTNFLFVGPPYSFAWFIVRIEDGSKVFKYPVNSTWFRQTCWHINKFWNSWSDLVNRHVFAPVLFRNKILNDT